VVSSWVCPRERWMRRGFTPAASRCVAYECLRVWMATPRSGLQAQPERVPCDVGLPRSAPAARGSPIGLAHAGWRGHLSETARARCGARPGKA